MRRAASALPQERLDPNRRRGRDGRRRTLLCRVLARRHDHFPGGLHQRGIGPGLRRLRGPDRGQPVLQNGASVTVGGVVRGRNRAELHADDRDDAGAPGGQSLGRRRHQRRQLGLDAAARLVLRFHRRRRSPTRSTGRSRRMVRDGITAGCTGGKYCPDSADHALPDGGLPPARQARRRTTSRRWPRAPSSSTCTRPTSRLTGSSSSTPRASRAAARRPRRATGNLPLYCRPTTPSRAAKWRCFFSRSTTASSHAPPPATGVFADVDPFTNLFAAWIEELARLQVTVGCGGGLYCPDASVTRGQMAVFMTKSFHRPDAIRFLEQASWGPDGRRHRRGADPRHPGLARRPERGADLELPVAAALARRHPRLVRRRVPAAQLRDVPAPDAVLHQRHVPAGSAAPARLVGAPQAGRRLGGHHPVPGQFRPVPAAARSERVRQLPRHPLQRHAQSGHGRFPQHRHEHEVRPQRELRPRDHAALLDRDRAAQSRRDHPERRQQQAAPELRPGRHRSVQAGLHGLVHSGDPLPAAQRRGHLLRLPDADDAAIRTTTTPTRKTSSSASCPTPRPCRPARRASRT